MPKHQKSSGPKGQGRDNQKKSGPKGQGRDNQKKSDPKGQGRDQKAGKKQTQANSKSHARPHRKESKPNRASEPLAQPSTEAVGEEVVAEEANGEKLQKVLARAGLGSRREMEKVISAGRVLVNEKVARLGDRISLSDAVVFDGRKISFKTPQSSRRRVLLYNKPEGEICSRSDPEGRRTVYDRLPSVTDERWISVGRLDFNTSGLLLFTNDGGLANKLMHPSSVIDREYLVRIQGDVDEDMKQRLRDGVMLEDGKASFTDIVDGAGEGRNRWFYCVVMEGRNREVRRLWESQGVKVSRLKRVRYGNIFIPSHVRVGQWLELNDKEVRDLCLTAGIEPLKNVPISREEKDKQERHQRKLRAGKGRRS